MCLVYVGLSQEKETKGKSKKNCVYVGGGEKRSEGERLREQMHTETKGVQDVQEACGG